MARVLAAGLITLLLGQEAGDAVSAKAKLHEELAVAAIAAGDQLIKAKAWDEARAFLEIIRAKSDARGAELDGQLAKTEKQSSGLKWDAKSSDLIKSFGRDHAKAFFAFARAWKEKDAESARWTAAEAEILDDLLDYVKAFARLTQIRAHYELPKTRFDWKLSVPAVWHSKYLLLNPEDPQEIEGKSGFTKEGSSSGRRSVSNRAESLTDLLEAMIHGAFHRIYVLNPNLDATGLGQAKGNVTAATIDVQTALATPPATNRVLPIPKDRSVEVPTTGYDDHTRVVTDKSMKDLGYPISLVFYDPTTRPKDVRASIRSSLKEVDFYLSTPDEPALPKRYPTNKNAIVAIPKSPLKPNTHYNVSVDYTLSGKRQSIEWSFTTGR